MKNYLYSISPEVWQVICDSVEFLDEDEQPTAVQLQKIHRNTQAISILTSSIDKEEFSTELVAWMWPKMCGALFGWLMKDQDL
jgi:hypothetical protein